MRLEERDKLYRLGFANGIQVEILRDGRDFRGLGQVRLGRRKLRSAELPIMPLVETPDGYVVSRLRIEELEKGEESLVVHMTPFVRRAGRMEWVGCDGLDRWNVGPWEQAEECDRGGTVQVRLGAAARTIGGIEFAGLCYGYKFRSRKYGIYRIQDRATWELGGRATGNSFWMEGPFNPPQKTVQNKDDEFTTAWCRPPHAEVQLQQFLPLFAVLQGFAFQFDRRDILLTAFEQPFHCLSLFQKNAGENFLVHWHQLCADLSRCVEFPALQVLCARSPCEDEIERANQYCAVRQELQAEYCDRMGLARERGTVSARLEGGLNPPPEDLARALDALARAGCRRVYAADLLRGVAPSGFEAAMGHPSLSEVQEAMEQLRRLLGHAHQRGIEVALPLAGCTRPWLLAGSEPQGAEAPASAQEGSERLLEHMRWLKRDMQVDALFAGSVLSSISDQFDWNVQSSEEPGDGEAAALAEGAPPFDERHGQIRSLHAPKVELLSRLQKMGFACPLAGAGGLAPVHGAAAAGLLPGREYMFRDRVVAFPEEAVGDRDEEPLKVYFRGCANRLMYAPAYDLERGARGGLSRWCKSDYGAVNRAYHAVREHMGRSHLLARDRGVLWSGDDPDVQVLWVFRDCPWAVGPGDEVFDVMAAGRVEPEGGEFKARAGRVYLIQTVAEP